MDISITTMTSTHLFIAGTLFGVLLFWIFLFALLALRPEAKTRVGKTSVSTDSTQVMSAPIASVQPSIDDTHIFEETSGVEVVQVV